MQINKSTVAAALAVTLAAAPWAALAQGKAKTAENAKPYPLEVCAVSGEPLDGSMGDPYVFVEDGREIKLCCKSCLKEFNKNKAKVLAKVEAAAKKVKAYPLDTCLVTGEKLGGMGDPYVFVHKGQEIKLCCKGCLKDFNKDKATYLKKLETAAK
jgi:hypothetical protein